MANGARDGRPTMVSLARDLGVSRQTISNVLNNPDIVNERTRARVLAAIEETGYRPSAIGRALRTQRSMTIGLRLYPAIDGINGAIMDRFTHSLTESAQLHGYRLTLLSAADAPTEVKSLEALHHVSAIDAAVLTDTFLDDPRPAALGARGLPFVAFGRPWGDPDAPHAWVDVDGRAGTLAATTYLRERGHTRIGFLGVDATGVSADRREGWAAGMAGSGVAGRDLQVLLAHDFARDGAEAAAVLRDRGATALVCASDSLALGAVGVFRNESADIPVIGFDDTPVASAVGISSVAQPVEAAAEQIIGILLGLLAGGPPRRVLLEPTLVLRNLEQFAS
nr:LacI family DNA-binding transcriptional regulator [Propionicimonas sp.]